MKFYTYKKEELGAINQFRESCIKDRLEIVVSRRAIASLFKIIKTKGQRVQTAVIGTANAMALGRRGLIREDTDGAWVVTELGLLTLAYAEVGGLLEEKAMRE